MLRNLCLYPNRACCSASVTDAHLWPLLSCLFHHLHKVLLQLHGTAKSLESKKPRIRPNLRAQEEFVRLSRRIVDGFLFLKRLWSTEDKTITLHSSELRHDHSPPTFQFHIPSQSRYVPCTLRVPDRPKIGKKKSSAGGDNRSGKRKYIGLPYGDNGAAIGNSGN